MHVSTAWWHDRRGLVLTVLPVNVHFHSVGFESSDMYQRFFWCWNGGEVLKREENKSWRWMLGCFDGSFCNSKDNLIQFATCKYQGIQQTARQHKMRQDFFNSSFLSGLNVQGFHTHAQHMPKDRCAHLQWQQIRRRRQGEGENMLSIGLPFCERDQHRWPDKDSRFSLRFTSRTSTHDWN